MTSDTTHSQHNTEPMNDQNHNSINNNNNPTIINAGVNKNNNINYNNNNNNTMYNNFVLKPQQQALIDTNYNDNRFQRSTSYSYSSNKSPMMFPVSQTPFYPTRTSQSYSSSRQYPYHLQQPRPMNSSFKTSATLPAISNCLNPGSILKKSNFHR